MGNLDLSSNSKKLAGWSVSDQVQSVLYFVTIKAKARRGKPFLENAVQIMRAANTYHNHKEWFLNLFLIMPTSLHMLLYVPSEVPLVQLIGKWKRNLTKRLGLEFQEDFFERRIQCDEQYRQKWNAILRLPGAEGLVADFHDWQYVIRNNHLGWERLAWTNPFRGKIREKIV